MQFLDVTIAGEINLDLILYGIPQEIPVEREVLATRLEATLGSSSAILAHNLAALGVATGFLTRMGQDELGEIAFHRLAESGVDLSRVVRATDSTSTGLTVLLHHGDLRRIVTYPGTMFEMSRADLDIEYLASARHFHLSSLFLHRALRADLPELFRELKSRGLTISLDTNDDPEDEWGSPLQELLPLVDILLPNKYELCRIAHRDSVNDALGELAPVVTIIAVKCGQDGAIVQERGKRTQVPPVAVQPVDTIGAGDSFNAGFLAAWLSGRSAEESAVAGNITGAYSTQRPGGTEAFRAPHELAAFLLKHNFPALRANLEAKRRPDSI